MSIKTLHFSESTLVNRDRLSETAVIEIMKSPSPTSGVLDGWRQGPLLDFFQLQRGHDLPVQDRKSGAVPIVASNGIVGFHNHSALAGLGVITGRSGTIGNVTYVEGPYWALNTTLYVRDFKGSDPLFVYYFLQNFPLKDYQSGTGVPTLNRNDVHSVHVRFPPADEQRRIAEVLRSVDVSISAAQATVLALSKVRQTTLDSIFQRFIGNADYSMRLLSEIAEVRTGLAKNKNRSGPKMLMPYLRVANVQDGWFNLTNIQEIEVDPAMAARYRLQKGDVLLTEGGDYDKLGRGGVWNGEIEPCLHQNHLFCVRSNRTILLPEYFALATQSYWGKGYFLSCAKRTTNLASINSSQLKAFPVPLIAITDQLAFVEEIKGIDAMIDFEERQLETLDRLRIVVASDLLCGRVRVPA